MTKEMGEVRRILLKSLAKRPRCLFELTEAVEASGVSSRPVRRMLERMVSDGVINPAQLTCYAVAEREKDR